MPNLPRVGEVIQIKNDGPRGSWKIGKIKMLNKGNDGKVRSVKIKLPSGKIISRSLTDIFPLECDYS